MQLSLPRPDDVASLIRETAAAEILPRFRNMEPGDRWRKRRGSVVTAADVAAERLLAARLTELAPGSVAVGEEMVEDRPDALERLAGDAPAWVIDPVDGTSNFAAGSPDFAVMVALVTGRRTVAGWIHRPVQDAMYVTEAGGGAFRDGERLRVAAVSGGPSAWRGSLGGALRRKTDLPRRFARVTATGSIGVDYCALVDGEIDFAHYRGTWVWDHAPGVLLHAEAGGFNLCLDGTPYRPGAPGEGGILLAPDRDTWDSLRDMIAPALARRR